MIRLLRPLRRAWPTALVGCAAVFAVASAGAEALSRADYAAHKRQIDADYRADQSACKQRTGQDLSLCMAKAQSRRKVAMAELDFNASGKASDAARLAAVKREADYAVASQRCKGLGPGADRERCLDRAEAARAGGPNAPRATPLRRY